MNDRSRAVVLALAAVAGLGSSALTVFLLWRAMGARSQPAPATASERRLPPPAESTAASPAAPGKRMALVIGNNDYPRMPLRNAQNDAKAITAALKSVGFGVTSSLNLRRAEMERAVNRFADDIAPGDVALFYYAGHAVQIEGENYLLPVDYGPNAKDEADAKDASYRAQTVLDKMKARQAKLRLIVLDACRENPFKGTRSAFGGLSRMDAASGDFVAFATAPNKTASDNPRGDNGLFTQHLIGAIQTPGLSLDRVFKQVKDGVYRESNGAQMPFTEDGVIGEFYLNPAPAPQPALVAATPRAPAPPAGTAGPDLAALDIPALVAATVNGPSSERLRAVRELGGRGASASPALSGLLELLRSPDPAVRAAAAEAIGRIGPTASAEVVLRTGHRIPARKLLERTGKYATFERPNGEPFFVEEAQVVSPALARLSPGASLAVDSVDPLAAALQDGDPTVRTAAAGALGELGPRARSAAAQLEVTAAADSDPAVRAAARAALVRVGKERGNQPPSEAPRSGRQPTDLHRRLPSAFR